MPTNVIEAGHARTYGSPWSTAGMAINEGLGQVLGYYQEYQRQKRFEAQQAQDAKIKAAEMAERAEQNKAIREDREDARNARRAQGASARALMMDPNADPSTLPEEWVNTETVKGQELAGPMPDGVSPLMGRDQTVKTPKKFVEYGDYVAPLDIGGKRAAATKVAEEQADWVTLPADLKTPNGVTYKAGTKVPAAIATAGGSRSAVQHIQDPVTGQIWGLDEATGTFTKPLGKVGVKAAGGDGGEGGKTFKTVYDKTTKEDVLATDQMISREPGRYGPAKKGDAGGGKPLLAGEARKIIEIRQGLAGIDDLRKTVSGQGSTGLIQRFAAWMPGVTNITGWGTDAKSRQATIKLVKQIIGKGLEGGVLRKEDEAKYADILPGMGDTTEVALNKVNMLEQRLRENEEIELDTLTRIGRDTSQLGSGYQKKTPKTDPYGLGL